MHTVLVTGGAGYVGSVCCHQLLDRGNKVVVIDNLSTGHSDAIPGDAEFYELDYGDRAAVARILQQHEFDAIFHFAAKALIPESVSNPGFFFDVNVASGIAFLETVRQFGIKNFIFSSSAAVYGSPQTIPIDEDQPKSPVNSYGETKLMFERALHWYATAYGWSAVAFRYFNASGATRKSGENHQPETHIIPLLLQVAAGEREYFEVYGDDYETSDGTCIRDYVHVSDIAAAHLLALETQHRGFSAYNIGAGKGYSVREVMRAVELVTGKPIEIRLSSRRPGDPAVLCASPAKLMRDLNWQPRSSSLQEIVRSAWEWKLQNRGVQLGQPAYSHYMPSTNSSADSSTS
ncbi:MAG TPA: UDP-glucose 4-epimerase GalE [Terriglobales bacterium]|nr:UDP-glucose 4-epimerase GalE [Terriglobales bacterium]